jgi:hypothetical protein
MLRAERYNTYHFSLSGQEDEISITVRFQSYHQEEIPTGLPWSAAVRMWTMTGLVLRSIGARLVVLLLKSGSAAKAVILTPVFSKLQARDQPSCLLNSHHILDRRPITYLIASTNQVLKACDV